MARPRSPRELEGAQLLTAHYYGDGRWGWDFTQRLDFRTQETLRGWTVSKWRPDGLQWGKSQSAQATVHHIVRYTIMAKHNDGTIVHFTQWICGGHCRTKVKLVSEYSVLAVCWGCRTRKEKPE